MEQPRAWIAGGYEKTGVTGLYRLRRDRRRLPIDGVVAPVCNVSAGVRLGTRLYLIDETASDIVVLDATRDWPQVARFSSAGQASCHLALNAARTLLTLADYGNGTTALFGLDGNGMPTGALDRYRHDGNGPVADRQEGPNAHWVGFAPDGMLFATDLGSDCILVFAPQAGQRGAARIVYFAPPGSGPRQIASHPDRPVLYLLCELTSTLTVLERRADGLPVSRQRDSTLPGPADSLGGAITLDRDRIHVTNRGHDSVAGFAIEADGAVRLIGHRASGGVSPRFLAIDGGHLLVGLEQLGGVTLLPPGCGLDIARAEVSGAAFLGALS